ncbi:MAG: type II secretion system secretin GspD, partial [Pseudomonadota bacterium]|nr:type II secretion system secretin GspD [Pseudomonadota bacterium]
MHAMLTNAKGFVIALVVSLLLFAKPVWGQEFTVNLKDTDIQEFIEFVADVTGTTIVIDPAVKGKVKVVSSKPVSRAELYDLFLSILDVHGYTAVRSGEVVRVIPNKNARSAPVDVISGTSVINDEYVTQVIRLDNVSAAKLIPVLRPLVPQQAHMAAYAPSNAIIISDIRANIDRIAKIIDRMDQSAVKKTEVVKLRYGVATDVVEMLKTLEKSRAGEGADANDEASLVADKRTNSVIVTADEVSIERIKGLIDYLDIPLEQSGNVRVMYLEYADATEVAEVLTRVMQNLARLDDESSGRTRAANAAKSTIEADEGTNSLIITADTDEMAALEAVIARLDIRRAQVLVEAIIVEIDVTEGRELGLQWLFANDSGLYGSNISPARQGSNAAIAQAILPEDAASTEIGVRDLAGALSQVPGTTFGWGVVDQNLTMTTILNTLEKQGNTNILSTPSLLTLDNEEAFITVGQQVPFVTGSYTNTGAANGVANPFQTIQRENVGVTLQVTPQINEGDSVVMDIVQEVSSISQQALSASDVITNERKIETKVLAK